MMNMNVHTSKMPEFEFYWMLLAWGRHGTTRLCHITGDIKRTIENIKHRFPTNKIKLGPIYYTLDSKRCKAMWCELPADANICCNCPVDRHYFCSESCRDKDKNHHGNGVHEGLLTDYDTRKLSRYLDSLSLEEANRMKTALCCQDVSSRPPAPIVPSSAACQDVVECAICMESNGELTRTHRCSKHRTDCSSETCCPHEFHAACLSEWRNVCSEKDQDFTCPLCRRPI